ncbi:hypothetical protein LR48_Vigan11g132200 [Vigna angularis]|uniref:Uncharacterized protein n=2 Tax=Phaseolus angularis TaxID=3914 RepID=A0A0L9VTM2_PHAAN|nr:hypothetical protein LR48_Vigan11g132200 [Vigna angularis]BAT97291.1 hypothetical protein VIGAN_09068900 [Vigna angularis var. angularis]
MDALALVDILETTIRTASYNASRNETLLLEDVTTLIELQGIESKLTGISDDIVIDMMIEEAKNLLRMCRRTTLHSNPSRKVTELEKFALFNLLTNNPFNLPHLLLLHLNQTLANYNPNIEECYCSLLIFKILTQMIILNRISNPSFPNPNLEIILSSRAARGERLLLDAPEENPKKRTLTLGESSSGRKKPKSNQVESLAETSSSEESSDNDGETINEIRKLIV